MTSDEAWLAATEEWERPLLEVLLQAGTILTNAKRLELVRELAQVVRAKGWKQQKE